MQEHSTVCDSSQLWLFIFMFVDKRISNEVLHKKSSYNADTELKALKTYFHSEPLSTSGEHKIIPVSWDSKPKQCYLWSKFC